MKKLLTIFIVFVSLTVYGQNQDVNPYGGVYYNDNLNVRNYGRFVLPRSETSNLDTLTNLVKGTLVFDSLENRVEYIDTNGTWVSLASPTSLSWNVDADTVYLGSTKRVGIGTSSPSYELDVVGNINASSIISATTFSATGNGSFTGEMNAGSGFITNDFQVSGETRIDSIVVSAIGGLQVSGSVGRDMKIDLDTTEITGTLLKVTTTDFQFSNGSESDGYVLTSDSQGEATWMPTVNGCDYDSLEFNVGGNLLKYYGCLSLYQDSLLIGTVDSFLFNGFNVGSEFVEYFTGNPYYLQGISVSNRGELQILDDNAEAGYVLLFGQDGFATWQPAAIRVLDQATGSATTTTAWETVGSYTIAANTLSDGSSLDIDFAMSGSLSSDSLLVIFGGDTCLLDLQGSDGYAGAITAFYASGGNAIYSSYSENKVVNGTANNSSDVAVVFKAKSATIGNQTLEFFRITYFE